jgi:hypothetical protein
MHSPFMPRAGTCTGAMRRPATKLLTQHLGYCSLGVSRHRRHVKQNIDHQHRRGISLSCEFGDAVPLRHNAVASGSLRRPWATSPQSMALAAQGREYDEPTRERLSVARKKQRHDDTSRG